MSYVERAIKFAHSAVKNKKKFCKWTRLAAQRFLKDYKRAKQKSCPFYFDEWHASDPCDFVEKLPHVEGKWDTPTIQLHDSQVFFLVNLFGFRSKETQGRRFTTALKAVARKNAKSTLSAAIGLYCETCEGEVGPQVVSAATTGSQARIVFNIAKRMVDMTPDLREEFLLESYANAIPCYRNGGTFKPINAKASTQDGLNPSTSLIDEVHAHKTGDLLNVLRSAAGARLNPLFLFTTTEGYESLGPWSELRKFAEQVLEGIIEADHFFVVIYAVDDGDDDFDEECWVKANPLMDMNPILIREIRKESIEAKSMPMKLAEFRIKRLNRRANAARGWIRYHEWKRCGSVPQVLPYPGQDVYGGLDLSNTQDLASYRLSWEVEEVIHTVAVRWVPGAAVKTRGVLGLVPYSSWVQRGLLRVCGDTVLDHEQVLRDIIELHEALGIPRGKVFHDTWNSAQLATKMAEEDFEMIPFVQGTRSFHPAMRLLEEKYLEGKLAHGDDPVLTWCASNLEVRHDINLNMAPDKKRSQEKIDDMVALLMSVSGLVPKTVVASLYESGTV